MLGQLSKANEVGKTTFAQRPSGLPIAWPSCTLQKQVGVKTSLRARVCRLKMPIEANVLFNAAAKALQFSALHVFFVLFPLFVL